MPSILKRLLAGLHRSPEPSLGMAVGVDAPEGPEQAPLPPAGRIADCWHENLDPTPLDVRDARRWLTDNLRATDIRSPDPDAHRRVLKALMGEERMGDVLRAVEGSLDIDHRMRSDAAVMVLVWVCAAERDPLFGLLLLLEVAARKPERFGELRESVAFGFVLGGRHQGIDIGEAGHRKVALSMLRGRADPEMWEHDKVTQALLGAVERIPQEGWHAGLREMLPRRGARAPDPFDPSVSAGGRARSHHAPIPDLDRPRGEHRVCSKVVANYEPLFDGLSLARLPDPGIWRDILAAEFPWMAPAIEMLARKLSLRTLAGSGEARFRLPPFVLHGPPGVGKSRFVRRLGEVANVPVHRFNASGHSGAITLLGSSRTYHDASPSIPVKAMVATRHANVILMIDEFDKLGDGRYNGNPSEALLGMLERETSARYPDDFLEAEVDLSWITFALTANDVYGLSPPLRDRLLRIECVAPGVEHFDTLLSGVLEDVAEELGVDVPDIPPLTPAMVQSCRKAFGAKRSVRHLRDVVETCLGDLVAGPSIPIRDPAGGGAGIDRGVLRFPGVVHVPPPAEGPGAATDLPLRE